MKVKDLKKAIEDLDDNTPVLYAWTWRSPSDLSLGSYMSGSDHKCLLLDGNQDKWSQQFGNEVLWEEK